MGYKVERLTAKDYDELLHLLNTVFHKDEGIIYGEQKLKI